MEVKQKNILAVIVWVIALLGCSGYINPFGFFALLIPLLFALFGNKLTKNHCKAYFNVLITATIIYFLALIIKAIISLFTKDFFNLMLIPLVYFAIMSIIGLLTAFRNKRYKPLLSANIIK